MPDLTLQTFYHCQSAETFSTTVEGKSGKHTVSYGPSNGRYQYDWHCTCHSFKFGKGKHCKHIEAVKESGKRCGWMQFTDGGEVVRKNGQTFCPNCGLPAHAQQHGV